MGQHTRAYERPTPEQRRHLAVDLSPGDTPLALFKRAAILRTPLLDVALCGRAAVLVSPRVKNTHRGDWQPEPVVPRAKRAPYAVGESLTAKTRAELVSTP